MLRAVTSDEPPRPRRLQPRLPRDLEAITLHCLQKEPHRRYQSAAALAEDLKRFREGKQVAARPVGSGARWLARAGVGHWSRSCSASSRPRSSVEWRVWPGNGWKRTSNGTWRRPTRAPGERREARGPVPVVPRPAGGRGHGDFRATTWPTPRGSLTRPRRLCAAGNGGTCVADST